MTQPVRNIRNKPITRKKKINGRGNRKRATHPEYGTSKLEERFAHNFLDKLGIRYQYQFKAESIGRYFDFYIPDCRVLLEVDGDYYHSYGLVYEDMNPMQKRNKRVDKEKDHWALVNGYRLYRIWEHEIEKDPSGVLDFLKEKLSFAMESNDKLTKKKKRH